jgi:hypothetical protein
MLCFLAVGSFAQLVDQLNKFRLNLGEILMCIQLLRPNKNIDATESILLVPKQFAEDALHVIAIHGSTRRFFPDDQTHTSMFQRIRHVMYDQELS